MAGGGYGSQFWTAAALEPRVPAMYILFFLAATVCGVAYLYLSWRVSDAAIRSVARKEPVCFPGTRRGFLVATTSLSFAGSLFLYLGLIHLAGAPVQPFCLVGVLAVTLVVGVVNKSNVKYVEFESDEKD